VHATQWVLSGDDVWPARHERHLMAGGTATLPSGHRMQTLAFSWSFTIPAHNKTRHNTTHVAPDNREL
jgi:hypothetical protein